MFNAPPGPLKHPHERWTLNTTRCCSRGRGKPHACPTAHGTTMVTAGSRDRELQKHWLGRPPLPPRVLLAPREAWCVKHWLVSKGWELQSTEWKQLAPARRTAPDQPALSTNPSTEGQVQGGPAPGAGLRSGPQGRGKSGSLARRKSGADS